MMNFVWPLNVPTQNRNKLINEQTSEKKDLI